MPCVRTLIEPKEQEKGPILNTHLRKCLQNSNSYEFIIINNITSIEKTVAYKYKKKKIKVKKNA